MFSMLGPNKKNRRGFIFSVLVCAPLSVILSFSLGKYNPQTGALAPRKYLSSTSWRIYGILGTQFFSFSFLTMSSAYWRILNVLKQTQQIAFLELKLMPLPFSK
jgi:hypothetical protein